MHCPRFIIEPKEFAETLPVPGSSLSLNSEQSHHLIRALRRSIGEKVELVLGDSKSVFLAEIKSASTDNCVVTLLEEIIATATAKISLLVALTKQPAVEFIAQHCTEAGVAEICFFHAKHSPRRLSSEKIENFLSRIRRITAAATQQSRSSQITKIGFTDSLENALEGANSHTPNSNHLRSILLGPAEIGKSLSQPPLFVDFLSSPASPRHEKMEGLENQPEYDEIYLMVGPEGGFSLEEIAIAQGFGFSPCSLGPQVFRTETAALLASALAGMLAARNKI